MLVFVVTGWIVSLCLHEFGHAVTAWHAGDTSIPATGYLSLDPLKYTRPVPLDPAAAHLHRHRRASACRAARCGSTMPPIRSAAWDSAVSAAGPLANVLFLLLLAGVYAAVPHGDQTSDLEAGAGGCWPISGHGDRAEPACRSPASDGFGHHPALPARPCRGRRHEGGGGARLRADPHRHRGADPRALPLRHRLQG